MLRPPEQVAELDAQWGAVSVYTDPILETKRRVYLRLIRRLVLALVICD